MKYNSINIENMNRRVAHPKDDDERTALLDIIETIEECEREGYSLIEALEWNRARRIEMIENKEGFEETPGICRAVIAEIDRILPAAKREQATRGVVEITKRYRT